METYEANLIAVGGYSKAVCLALLRLGMRRCSDRYVRYQCERRDLHLDWYGLFWRWLEALWLANRAGAEFLLDDLLVRVARLRDLDDAVDEGRACWRAQMVRCETEHSDIVKAAMVSDLEQIRRETVQDIEQKRLLLALVDAELKGSTAHAA